MRLDKGEPPQSVKQVGNYLTWKACQFFEQKVLQNNGHSTLSDFFKVFFLLILEWDKFGACQQQDLSALDFIHQLHNVADIVWDLDKSDVILAFLCRSQPFICTELIWARFKLLDLTLVEPKSLVIQIELAEMTIKDQKRLKTERPNGSSSWKNRVGKKSLIWYNSSTKKHG